MRHQVRHAVLLALAGSMFLAQPALARKGDKADERAAITGLDERSLKEAGANALRAGDTEGAIGYFSEIVARNPRDGASQTLLGFAYQRAASQRPEAIDLALAGYDLASRVEPGNFWSAALAGRTAYDQGRYEESLEQFSRALLLRPSDGRLAAAVAASAYMAGDSTLAALAAARASAMYGETDPAILRLAAMAAASSNDAPAAERYLRRLDAIAPTKAAGARERVSDLLRTASLDMATGLAGAVDGAVDGAAAPLLEASPTQVSLDVAIILSQNTQTEHTGLNLLDGLGLQYGLSRNSTRSVVEEGGVRVGSSYQRVLTASVSVPQLNYNLNLFNRGGQYYSVVARPQLTAYLGEQSDFFVGRTVHVAVSGIQLGSLEKIDIGVNLRVTPVSITETGTLVRIEAERSFLTSDPAGRFSEALTQFRQKVSATAEIRFGETLMLSGLNEHVEDRTFSKTPGLGDVPLIGLAFSERNRTKRNDAVMVLVTPAPPARLPGAQFVRPANVKALADLWTQVIDPMSNASAVAGQLTRMVRFTRMARSDVALAFPDAKSLTDEVILALGTTD